MHRRWYLTGIGGTVFLSSFTAGGQTDAPSRVYPPESVTVAPGTTVRFEVTVPDGVEQSTVEWAGTSSEARRIPDYENATGNAAIDVPLDASTDLTATVPDGDGGTETVRWQVTVEQGGPAEPTVETLTTAPDPSETIGADTPVDITAAVADDAAALDRIVWTEGRNETIITLTEVSGSQDTETLSFSTPPPWIASGYPTTATVLTTDGRRSDLAVTEGPAVRQPITVDIVETTAPVVAGEVLDVTIELENSGELMMTGPDTQTIELVVGGETVDSETVSVGWAETETITLGYETVPVDQDVEFPVRAVGADDEDEQRVRVFGTERDALEVTFPSCKRAEVTGRFEDGDTIAANTVFYENGSFADTLGEFTLTVGDDVTAPLTGTIVFQLDDSEYTVTETDDGALVTGFDFGDTGSVITGIASPDQIGPSPDFPHPESDVCLAQIRPGDVDRE